MTFVDAYAVLGVSPRASQDELKAAHRRLAREHHPDLAPPGRRVEATQATQRLNLAYGLVRDPAARAEYDEVRRAYLAGHAAGRAERSLAWERLVRSAGRWAGASLGRHAPSGIAYRLGTVVGRFLR